MHLAGTFGAARGGDYEVEVIADFSEPTDDGVLADPTGPANDDD